MNEGNAALALDEQRDWIFREYTDADESALMYLLGVSYARSKSGYRAGAATAGRRRDARVPDHESRDREQAYLDAHAPIWRWLLANADVTLAVDPQAPDTDIWGWMLTSGPTVLHAIGAKRSVIKAGLGADLIRDMAGERWTSHQVTTLELPQFSTVAELRRLSKKSHLPGDLLGMPRPYEWAIDPTWLLTRMVAR